jgi:hypothetical protein
LNYPIRWQNETAVTGDFAGLMMGETDRPGVRRNHAGN